MAKLESVVPWVAKDSPKYLLVALKRESHKTFLCVINDGGDPVEDGELFSVGPYGCFRTEGVDPNLGFPLDDKGRIKLDA